MLRGARRPRPVVCGAAHGSYLLVVSVPVIVCGSTMVLKLVDRFPALVYRGAGVVVWAAVKISTGEPLLKVLVPVDGSVNALHAVRHGVGEFQPHDELELHSLNVQPRRSRHISRFVSRSNCNSRHQEQAEAALARARAGAYRVAPLHCASVTE